MRRPCNVVKDVLILVAVMMMVSAGQVPPADSGEDPGESPGESPGEESVRGEALLPLTERQRMFEIVEGDRRGELVNLVLRRTRDGELGTHVLRMSDLNTLYLRRNDEGDVEVLRLDLPRENRAVVYEPAVRLIPGQVRPRLRVEEAGLARVYDLETGEFQRRGAVQHAVKEVSRARFHTPGGEQAGYMVVIEHSIDLDLGELRMEMECGYVPGEGMVYRHLRYTIEKLGLFGSTTRRTAVLAESLDEGDE